MADLRWEIGADVSDLRKAIQIATQELGKLGKEQDDLAASFVKSGGAVDGFEDKMLDLARKQNTLRTSIQGATRSMNNMGGSIKANAVPAMQEFSRIVQDSPYGIQGVANNIQQLTAQFQYLAASAGGGRAAFKLMAASIWGPAGILLAVSALTALLPLAYQYVKDLQLGAGDLGKAFREASDDIGKSIGRLNQLITAYQDSGTSAEEKTLILQKLKDEYPGYIQDLADEKKAVGESTTAYQTQTKAIIANGIEKAFQAKRDKIYAKQVELQLKSNFSLLNASQKASIGQGEKAQRLIQQWGEENRKIREQQLDDELASIDKQSDAIKERYGIRTADYVVSEKDKSKARDAEAKERERIAAREAAEEERRKKREAAEFARIEKQKTKEYEKQLKLRAEAEASRAKLEYETGDRQFSPSRFGFGGADGIETDMSSAVIKTTNAVGFMTDTWSRAGSVFREVSSALRESTPVWAQAMQTTQQTVADGAESIQEDLTRWQDSMATLLGQGLQDAFSTIGDIIGMSLAGASGTLENAGNQMLGMLGKFISQLGSLLITYGTLVAAKGKADAELIAGDPVTKIAAGTAAIAIGAAAVIAGAAITSFAKASARGNVSGASVAGSGSPRFAGSTARTATGGSTGGEYTFIIEGRTLVGVLSRELKYNRALSSSLSL